MKRILKEPLLQFLLSGAVLFVIYAARNRDTAAGPTEVVVSAGHIEHLSATFAQLYRRPPAPAELKGLIDQYVREEILSREAVKLGLDRDDAVIRRRLQQKLEFVASDLAAIDAPTQAELEAWLAKHAERYRTEPVFSFEHVYLSPDRRGARLEADATALLAELRQRGPAVDVDSLGDSFLLAHAFDAAERSTVAAKFGAEFAAQLAAAPLGEWFGPVRSGFGMHLVLVTKRDGGGTPGLESVRERVARDLRNARRLEANERFLDGLLAQYTVKIEWPKPAEDEARQAVAQGP